MNPAFEQTPVYQKYKSRILGLVRLAQLNQHTFGANLSDMLARGMTFAEADASALINDASKWVTAQFKEAATEAAAGMLIELRAETVKVEKAARTAVLAAWASGIIGVVALAAIFGFGLAGL